MADNGVTTINDNALTDASAIDQDLPKVMEGINQTSPTDAQADQYSQTASDIDANRPNPMPMAPPGVPPTGQTPQSNGPQNGPNGQPNPNLAQAKNTPAPQPAQPVNPVTQKAGWVHDIAQTLAGGPRYQYKVNPSTGEMEKTPVPVSARHIGLALALEAIGGAATGLAEGKGAGNKGKGAAAAFEQGRQIRQQQDEKARKEASDNYARGAAIAQTNIQMLRNEQISAQADSEFQQKDVDQYADEYNDLQNIGAIRQTGITGDEALRMMNDKKLNVTSDMLIPYQVREQVGPDGRPVLTPHGAPKFEKLYALTDPMAEITPSADLIARAQKAKLPGFVNGKGEPIDLPSDLKMRAHMVSGLQEALRPYQQTDESIKNLGTGQEHVLHNGTTPNAPGELPVLKDQSLSDISDNAADKNDLDKGLFRAVALQESGGKADIGDSKPNSKGVYAVGPFQVTPGTAAQFTNPDTGKPYTEKDIRNPVTNAEVAATYLSNLVKANNGDIHKALVQYHGAGADSLGMTGEKYANQVLSKYTPSENTTGGIAPPATEAPPTPPTSLDAIDKGLIIPKDLQTLQKLHGAPTLFDGQWSSKDVVAMSEKDKSIDPASVGRLMNWLGPTIDYKYQQNQDKLQRIKAGYGVEKSNEINENKTKVETAQQEAVQQYLIPPADYKFDPSADVAHMAPVAATQYLQNHGVKVPPNIAALQAIATNEAPISIAAQKLYKDVPKFDAQDVESYIRTFIKPDYNTTDYQAAQKFKNDLTPGGKVGQNLLQAGIASNHLDLAEQALKNLNNRDLPAWNAVANEFGVQKGDAAPKVYAAVADVLSNEVGKVVSGGSQAYEAELKRLHDTLSTSSSPQQALGVMNAYVGLMNGRINEVNDQSKQYFGKEIHVSPQVAKIFGSRGYYVPGYGTPLKGSDGGLYFSKSGDPSGKDAVKFGAQ